MTVWGASPAKTFPVRSDAEITRVFREKLAKSKLAADGIQIRVQEGIATLTGKTDIAQHKGTATRMARTAGAREVRNQIAVSLAGRQRMVERLASGKPRFSPAPSKSNAAAPTTGAAAAPPASQAPPPVRRAQVKHTQ